MTGQAIECLDQRVIERHGVGVYRLRRHRHGAVGRLADIAATIDDAATAAAIDKRVAALGLPQSN